MPFRRGVESAARCKYGYIPPLFKKIENIDFARRVDPMNFAGQGKVAQAAFSFCLHPFLLTFPFCLRMDIV